MRGALVVGAGLVAAACGGDGGGGGGTDVVLAPVGPATEEELGRAADVVRERAEGLGDVEVSTDGDRIVVTFARVEDGGAAAEVLVRSADLRFRPVLSTVPGSTGPADGTDATATSDGGSPGTQAGDDGVEEPEVLADRAGELFEVGPPAVGGGAVESADARLQNGQWTVDLVLREGADGIDAFNELATRCFGMAPDCPTGLVAVVVDGVVESAPSVQQPEYARDAISISGAFTEDEARALATALASGPLPVPLEVTEPG